jgi:hypothetical protein
LSAALLQLPEFTGDQVSPQWTQVTDEKYAVTVIGFMQEATSREPGRFALESFPFDVLRPQDDALGAFEIRMYLTD